MTEEEKKSEETPEEEIPEAEDISTNQEPEEKDAAEMATVVFDRAELELTETGEIAPMEPAEPEKEETEPEQVVEAVQEELPTVEEKAPEEIVPGEYVPEEVLPEEEILKAEKPELSPEEKDRRRKLWLQFPRRLLLLLISFGIALGLLELLKWAFDSLKFTPSGGWKWDEFTSVNTVAASQNSSYLEASLVVILAAVGFALLIALIIAGLSVLNNKFKPTPYAPMGSLIKALGRFVFFPILGGSILLTAFVLLFLFQGNISANRLWLTSLSLSLLPGLLSGQALSKALTNLSGKLNIKIWLIELLNTLGNLLDMVGVFISGMVVLDVIFGYLGIGQLLFLSLNRMDLPTAMHALQTIVILVAIHRVVAQLFRWAYRLLKEKFIPDSESDAEALEDVDVAPPDSGFEKFIKQRWAGISRIIWVVLSILLLIIPIGIFVYGSTNPTGNDMFNRFSIASTTNLLAALGIGGIVIVISGLIGILCGYLQSKGKFWSESLADLFLMVGDVGLMFPIIPFTLVLMEWLMPPRLANAGLITTDILPANAFILTMILIGFLLAARGARFAQSLWMACPAGIGRVKKVLLALPYLGGFFFAAAYAGLWYETALSYLARGIREPEMSFGQIILRLQHQFINEPTDLIVTGVLLTLVMFTFYLLADALIGYFTSKEPINKLFE